MRSSKLKVQSSIEVPGGQGPRAAGNDDWLDGVSEPEWVHGPLILRDGPSSVHHAFDLLERTAVFGEQVVKFCRRVPRNPVNDRLVGQLAGATTSVGANYCEANEAVSPKDFRFTVSRCVKEAKETRHFLRMVVASEPSFANDARPCTSKPPSCCAFVLPCSRDDRTRLELES